MTDTTASESSAPAPAPGRGAARVRWAVAVVLLVLGTLLVPVTVLATWARNQIGDTDRYLATVAPLASDAAIQSAVADRLSTAVTGAVDVPKIVDDAVGPKGKVLAAPLQLALGSAVDTLALKVVRSNAFERVWTDANRVGHDQLVKLLTGDSKGPRPALLIDLRGASGSVVSRLEQAGLPVATVGGPNGPQVTLELFSGKQIDRIRSVYHLGDLAVSALPWVTLLVLAGAVLVAPRRRSGIVAAGTAVVVGAAIVLIGLAVGRALFLDAVPPSGSTTAAAHLFDTLVRFVRGATRALLATGLLVVVAGWLAGPGRAATSVRRAVGRATTAAGTTAAAHGADGGAAGRWAALHAGALRGLVGVVAALVLLLWDRPTATVVVWTGVAAAVALVVLEVLVRSAGGAAAAVDAGPSDD